MKDYLIRIYLMKKVEGEAYRITIKLMTRRASLDEALEAAQRYYTVAQAEEKATGDGWEVKEIHDNL